jgi:hypothetical protein
LILCDDFDVITLLKENQIGCWGIAIYANLQRYEDWKIR